MTFVMKIIMTDWTKNSLELVDSYINNDIPYLINQVFGHGVRIELKLIMF